MSAHVDVRFTPADWVHAHARHEPGRVALVDGISHHEHTFGELATRIDAVVAWMRSVGVGRGDRVALLDTDSVDYVVAVIASMRVGSTIVPLNYRLARDELVNICRHADPVLVGVGGGYVDMVEPMSAVAPRLREVFGFDLDVGAGRLRNLAASGDQATVASPDVDWEDIVSMMFTSGTTGRPKGVLQSLRMVDRVTMSGVLDFRFRRDEFRYSASPMFHVAGLGCVYYGLARGFRSLVLPQFDAEALVEWLERGLTGFLAMPTMVDALLRLPRVSAGRFPNLRSIAYGGAPMRTELVRELIEVFGCDLFNSFGAGTEAGGQTMLYPEDHERALRGSPHLLGSIGRPMYGVELRLCDADLVDVESGEVGEIVTRSNTVMSGYLDDPGATASAMPDGWFRAGDMAWRDDEGYLYLATRKSEMIIRGGENVYPAEIETTLVDHPDVIDAAVFGLADTHWGEVVAAAVVIGAGCQLDVEGLQRHCRERLASYKVPVRIISLDELPRNANGKVQRHRLAEHFGAPDEEGNNA